MNPTARILALIVGLSTTSAFAQADLSEAFLPMFMPLPAEVASASNELTEAKINLGRQLYFETRISKGGKMSCNSCHVLEKYGNDLERAIQAQSGSPVGYGSEFRPRN